MDPPRPRSAARPRPPLAGPEPNREARDHDDHASSPAAVRARVPAAARGDRPALPFRAVDGLLPDGPLAGPAPDGAAPQLPPGGDDRRGARPNRIVPDPRPL